MGASYFSSPFPTQKYLRMKKYLMLYNLNLVLFKLISLFVCVYISHKNTNKNVDLSIGGYIDYLVSSNKDMANINYGCL